MSSLTTLVFAIRRVLPPPLAAVFDRYRQRRRERMNHGKSVEEVFTAIYATNRWGGKRGTFFSGDGSRDDVIVRPYVAAVGAELERLGASSLTAVDLGCGDFSVGRQLAEKCGHYIGVDIVKPLIEHHQQQYGTTKVRFEHRNIVDDALPAGDICFIRQVLQHLSNDQISAVLTKLQKFRWCFITEHHPSPDRTGAPNQDKAHGSDIRVSLGSGVYLDAAPFNVPSARYRLLLEVPGALTHDGSDRGVIRTYLYTVTAPQA